MASTNTQQDEQISQMDVDQVNKFLFFQIFLIHFLSQGNS
jgi:hypothetical protein